MAICGEGRWGNAYYIYYTYNTYYRFVCEASTYGSLHAPAEAVVLGELDGHVTPLHHATIGAHLGD
jgi:hypothetical protein